MEYIATFYAHFGAIRFKKGCDRQGYPARVMPVPRSLSSSCGTCVKYTSDDPWPETSVKDEVEQIVEIHGENYVQIYKAADS